MKRSEAAWMLYVKYAAERIAETFQPSEEERRQLFHFRDAITTGGVDADERKADGAV